MRRTVHDIMFYEYVRFFPTKVVTEWWLNPGLNRNKMFCPPLWRTIFWSCTFTSNIYYRLHTITIRKQFCQSFWRTAFEICESITSNFCDFKMGWNALWHTLIVIGVILWLGHFVWRWTINCLQPNLKITIESISTQVILVRETWIESYEWKWHQTAPNLPITTCKSSSGFWW